MNADELKGLIEGLEMDESLILIDKEGGRIVVQLCARGWLFKCGNMCTYADSIEKSTPLSYGLFLYHESPAGSVKVGSIRRTDELTYQVERIM